MTDHTYQIPSWRVDDLRHRLGILARRAQRKGLTPLAYTIGEPRAVEVGKERDPISGEWRPVLREVQDVTISVEIVSAGPWGFICRIEHFRADDGPVKLVSGPPGAEPPAWAHDREPDCDHCGLKRDRRLTYVVKHAETAELRHVGSTCLRDFLGHDPARWCAAAEYVCDVESLCGELASLDDDGCRGGGGRINAYAIDQVLRPAAACTVHGGYVSRDKAERSYPPIMPTADRVRSWLAERKRPDDIIPADAFDDRAAKLADDTAAWLGELAEMARTPIEERPPDSPLENDYRRNLAAVARLGYVPARAIGLAASACASYERKVQRELDNAEAAKSRHQGTVGQRIGLNSGEPLYLTVTLRKGYEGAYGWGSIVKFRDDAGNLFLWFASGEVPLNVGERVPVVAHVKAHDEDKYQGGAAVTVINRVVSDPDKVEAARKRAARRAGAK